MTEEEKKAIEYLKYMGKHIGFNLIGYVYGNETIQTVLNLVKKQQEEIEVLKWKNKIYVKSIKSHKRELEKKDKIIDLMARAIDSYDSQLIINSYKDKEHVKETFEQYFENKVEGSK